ncbi:hypothetical protein N7494_009844 [Penicillium frequentans]|uniref:Uncharacterized protein n=1 Tax=Penicillium frequentans TaxID=3151616 RepID=A0AAD6CQQ1_9EURO|nr:hypothetical protein N7494_009844 [Penicillium glabrum]
MPELSDPQEKAPSSPHQPSLDSTQGDEESSTIHADIPQISIRDEVSEQPSRSSFSQRWRTASQRIRNRGQTIAERLGRPHEREEDGLEGAGFSTEYFGATDDLRSFAARQANDEEERLNSHDHDAQAQLLVRHLGLPGVTIIDEMHHRKSRRARQPPEIWVNRLH